MVLAAEVPPAGLEPTHPAPEAGALSTELRGPAALEYSRAAYSEQPESGPRGGPLSGSCGRQASGPVDAGIMGHKAGFACIVHIGG